MHLEKHLDLETLKKIQAHIEAKQASHVVKASIDHRELNLVCRQQFIVSLLTFLRDDKQCQFTQLVDISGADYPERKDRFDVVYHLLSMHYNQRIRVRVQVAEGVNIPTVVDVFPCANWYEREVYDMYGVAFEGHPDLRRILSDYDFDGFPLRKDFPLEGRVEMFYDEKEKRCVYKPVNLAQEFRHFDQVSDWVGMGHNAHLAEEDKPFSMDEFNAEVKN